MHSFSGVTNNTNSVYKDKSLILKRLPSAPSALNPIAAAFTPFLRNYCIWSSRNAIVGVITTDID